MRINIQSAHSRLRFPPPSFLLAVRFLPRPPSTRPFGLLLFPLFQFTSCHRFHAVARILSSHFSVIIEITINPGVGEGVDQHRQTFNYQGTVAGRRAGKFRRVRLSGEFRESEISSSHQLPFHPSSRARSALVPPRPYAVSLTSVCAGLVSTIGSRESASRGRRSRDTDNLLPKNVSFAFTKEEREEPFFAVENPTLSFSEYLFLGYLDYTLEKYVFSVKRERERERGRRRHRIAIRLVSDNPRTVMERARRLNSLSFPFILPSNALYRGLNPHRMLDET